MNARQYMNQDIPFDEGLDLTQPEPLQYRNQYLTLHIYSEIRLAINAEDIHSSWVLHYLRDVLFEAMEFDYPFVDVDAVVDLEHDNYYAVHLAVDELLSNSTSGRNYLEREAFYDILEQYKVTDLVACDPGGA